MTPISHILHPTPIAALEAESDAVSLPKGAEVLSHHTMPPIPLLQPMSPIHRPGAEVLKNIKALLA